MAGYDRQHAAYDGGESMKLIERYVHDVTRRLPEKQRADVARELSAEIEEMVEARAKGKRPTKKHIYDVLVEMGNPRLLADQYRDAPRFLIGPEYYEMYITLLKTIYLIVLPILIFILWMTESLTTNHGPWSLIFNIVGVAFEASVHIFFWTTLSFLVVQKFTTIEPQDHDWKPEDLPDRPVVQEIPRSDSFFAIAWLVFAVLATLFQIPAIYAWLGPDDVPQFFAPGMWPYWTLGLLGISLLGLITEFIKLKIGAWTKATVALITLANIVTVGFFVATVTYVHPIANPALLDLIASSLNRPTIANEVHTGIVVFVIIVTVISAWEIGEAIYKYKKGGK